MAIFNEIPRQKFSKRFHSSADYRLLDLSPLALAPQHIKRTHQHVNTPTQHLHTSTSTHTSRYRVLTDVTCKLEWLLSSWVSDRTFWSCPDWLASESKLAPPTSRNSFMIQHCLWREVGKSATKISVTFYCKFTDACFRLLQILFFLCSPRRLPFRLVDFHNRLSHERTLCGECLDCVPNTDTAGKGGMVECSS